VYRLRLAKIVKLRTGIPMSLDPTSRRNTLFSTALLELCVLLVPLKDYVANSATFQEFPHVKKRELQLDES